MESTIDNINTIIIRINLYVLNYLILHISLGKGEEKISFSF